MPVAAVSVQDAANVLATVTSQTRGFPPCYYDYQAYTIACCLAAVCYSDEWQDDVQSYVPVFSDGWSPPAHWMSDIGPEPTQLPVQQVITVSFVAVFVAFFNSWLLLTEFLPNVLLAVCKFVKYAHGQFLFKRLFLCSYSRFGQFIPT